MTACAARSCAPRVADVIGRAVRAARGGRRSRCTTSTSSSRKPSSTTTPTSRSPRPSCMRRALPSAAAPAPPTLRVIRRNNQVVPWSEQKIEIAVRKAFLSLERDPAPAAADRRARHRARAVAQARPSSTSRNPGHRAGGAHAAATTGRRALHPLPRRARACCAPAASRGAERRRAASRDRRRAPTAATSSGTAPISASASSSPDRPRPLPRPRRDRGRAPPLGLRPDLPEGPRPPSSSTRRPLIERDADFAKFAGRIQLTYIYEEISAGTSRRDGIGGLKRLPPARLQEVPRARRRHQAPQPAPARLRPRPARRRPRSRPPTSSSTSSASRRSMTAT